ncbi:chromosomal replication initiator protein DnaA [Lutibaculum baratangense]|uniref:Chromosomal replication initiator protein DnaA n=1 Tax=Lutibaculum baratangense AMV1 TaxID=631454 RepID=V4QUU4_9HYPH|nr:chromosomal replication initiator protein DnaA [Lutibaculum baratangense]ESR23512.1 Chromosomal replication initiator protein DnaA [Lutibaculum baratangense AMV1]
MTRPRQLALSLPHRPALSRDDFLVGAANRAALQAVEAWPDWAYGALLLLGPEGSGKTHLAEVWRARSGASRIAAGVLRPEDVPALAEAGPIAVEDCDRGVDERALFHLVNESDQRGSTLLLTARSEPATWRLVLPDLRSRLARIPTVALGPVDDELLAALMVKLFADRQITVEPGLVRYLIPRVERSFAGASRLVARLDELAIEEKKPVTRALASRILREEQAP